MLKRRTMIYKSLSEINFNILSNFPFLGLTELQSHMFNIGLTVDTVMVYDTDRAYR